MHIVQTVPGVFHHFELARELDRRGHLERVESTWPWFRLKREGLPRDRVETFPWLHVPEYLLLRADVGLHGFTDRLSYANTLAFDRWTEMRLRSMRRSGVRIDALIGLSGTSLRSGRAVQRANGIFVCDSGSTHARFKEQTVSEEFRRWGVELAHTDPRDVAREEAIYAQADAITVPSSFAARSFVEMGVAAEKVHVIPYGVRLERFRPVDSPCFESPREELRILFAGAACLRKGVPYLLQAFAALRQPRKRLRIAGPVMADLRAVLPRLPTAGVEFLGALPQERLAAVMRQSDVLVLPSVEDGFGLVMAQAMACGCAVVSSTHTGGQDLYTDGVEGFIVPPRHPEAMTARLQRLADDPEFLRAMREKAGRRVRLVNGWTDYGDRWVALLSSLLSPTAPGDTLTQGGR